MPRRRENFSPKAGENLKAIRKDHDLTQEQFCSLIHYAPTHLSAVENGHKPVTQEMANAIIKLFPEYRIDWILGSSDIKTHDDFFSFKERARLTDIVKREEKLSALLVLSDLGNSSKVDCHKDGSVTIRSSVYPQAGLAVTVNLSAEQVAELVSEVSELARIRINWLFHLPFPKPELTRIETNE